MNRKTKVTELLTYKEVSKVLKVSVSHLRTLVSKKKIPFFRKQGVGVRFILDDVVNWYLTGD